MKMDKFSDDALKILERQPDEIEFSSVSKIVNLLVQSSTQREAFDVIKSTRSIWDRIYIYAYIMYWLNRELRQNNKEQRPKYILCLQTLNKSDTALQDVILRESSADFSYFYLEENKNFLEDVLVKIKECNDINKKVNIIGIAAASKPRFFTTGYLIDQIKFLYLGLEEHKDNPELSSKIVSYSTNKINLILAVKQGNFQKVLDL